MLKLDPVVDSDTALFDRRDLEESSTSKLKGKESTDLHVYDEQPLRDKPFQSAGHCTLLQEKETKQLGPQSPTVGGQEQTGSKVKLAAFFSTAWSHLDNSFTVYQQPFKQTHRSLPTCTGSSSQHNNDKRHETPLGAKSCTTSREAAAPLVKLMSSLQVDLNSFELSQHSMSAQTRASANNQPARQPVISSNKSLDACVSAGYGSSFPAASGPAVTNFEEAQHTAGDDPDYVQDSQLRRLTHDELHDQCVLRGKLTAKSEQHEKEMADGLTHLEEETERKIAEHKHENMQLKEENERLRQQIAESRQPTVSCQHCMKIQSLEDLSKQAAAAVQMITILFTCQARDFVVHKMIAHGCEGAVFVAECVHPGAQLLAGKIFALKVMFNVFGHSTFTQVRSFYQNEYRALCAMLPHQNIIRLFAFFYDRVHSGFLPNLPPVAAENARMLSLFLIMEHIPKTLEQVALDLRKTGNLTAKQVMKWSLQIFRGIEHLLKHRYIHRDMKLNNVLVTDEGVLKICDFGCSIQLSENMTIFYAPGSSLGGNPAHMPPEILNAAAGTNIQCDSQDLWASGVMTHEMACGRSPFATTDQRGYRMSDIPQLKIENEKCLGTCPADIVFPVEFTELVMSLLDFEPSKRPAVGDAIDVTQQLLDQMD